MSITVKPLPETVSQPRRAWGGPRRAGRTHPTPGRDLAAFLLLLLGIDVSGLLHVYSLSSIYPDALFYGLGLLFVALAVWLLVGPSGGEGLRLRPATVGGWAVAAGGGLILAGLGVQQLIAALPFARVKPDDPPLLMPARDEKTLLALVLVGLPALALALAYSRWEPWRRRGLLLVAAGWFGYAVGNLLFHLTGGPNGPAWSATVERAVALGAGRAGGDRADRAGAPVPACRVSGAVPPRRGRPAPAGPERDPGQHEPGRYAAADQPLDPAAAGRGLSPTFSIRSPTTWP